MNNESLKEMLITLNRQFDQETAIGGLETWVSYFAEDSVMVMATGNDVKGKTAIKELMAKPFALPGFSLRWEPIDCTVSDDGSLGYTYGKYVRRHLNNDGNEVISTGKYTTVWKRQNDSSWKIILDMGN